MTSSYSASDIEVLSGLEPVRRRPGMYTDTTRPNHLAHEVIDNSVDEALAGHCDEIEVTLFKDGSLQVTDNGRGMPVDIHPKEKLSGVELILTRLHAGGKFNDSSYKFSGGLHGVGVSVVNALSDVLDLSIHRGGTLYTQQYQLGNPVAPLAATGVSNERGTTIRFRPSPNVEGQRSSPSTGPGTVTRTRSALRRGRPCRARPTTLRPFFARRASSGWASPAGRPGAGWRWHLLHGTRTSSIDRA